MTRDEAVDISKGIGIMLVILGHMVFFNGSAFRYIFAFHMPLFYVLMGMIFPYSLNLKKYFHKAKKLLLSYLFFLLVGIVITFSVPFLRAGFSFDESTWSLLFYDFDPDCFWVGSIWFLFNAFVVITLYFLLSKLVFLPKRLKTKTKEIALTAAVTALSVGGVLVFNRSPNALYVPLLHLSIKVPSIGLPSVPFKLDTAISALLFFYVGVLLNKSSLKNRLYDLKVGFQIGGAVLSGLVVLVVARMNNYVNICNCHFGNPLYFYIAAFSGVLMVLLASAALRNIKLSKILSFFGRDSLWCFALHSFPSMAYSIVLNKILGQKYGYLYTPLPWALLSVPAVLLMLTPVIVSKNFVLKRIRERKSK